MTDRVERDVGNDVPWDTLGQEFPSFIPDALRGIVTRAYELGVAAGAASVRAELQAAQMQSTTESELIPTYPHRADLLAKLRLLPGVKIIGDIPVTTAMEMNQYGIAVLGRRVDRMGSRLWNILVAHKSDGPVQIEGHGLAKRLFDATHFYDAQEQPTAADDTALYLDLFGMLDMAKGILVAWHQTEELATGVSKFGEGLFRYLVGYLNYKLELDPPLELPNP